MARDFLRGFNGTIKRRTAKGELTTEDVTSYFNVNFGPYNPSDKTLLILVEEYDNVASFEANQGYIQQYRYYINESNGFDTYFSEIKLMKGGKTLLSQAHEFLKTLDGTDAWDSNQIDFSTLLEVTPGV